MIRWSRAGAIAACCATLAIADAASVRAEPGNNLPGPAATYLSPRGASLLPPAFRRELVARGCRVPQAATIPTPPAREVDNVIVGAFAKRGQTDHAAFCSVDGVTHVEIHWGGAAHCPQLPDRWNDRESTGITDGGEHGFLLAIDRVEPKAILEMTPVDDTPSIRPSHDGIDIVELVKGNSMIRYCLGGHWETLPGMD